MKIDGFEVAERARKIFDKVYTIHDIIVGDNVAMHKECYEEAIRQLKEEQDNTAKS